MRASFTYKERMYKRITRGKKRSILPNLQDMVNTGRFYYYKEKRGGLIYDTHTKNTRSYCSD